MFAQRAASSITHIAGAALLALVLNAALVERSEAQPAANSAAQRQEHFENGLEAARQQDYAAAYRSFRSAAELEREMSPATMYNLALAAAQLPQHELRAAAGFRAYLIAAPDANNAAEVTREIRRLQTTFERRLTATLEAVEAATPATRDAFYAGTDADPRFGSIDGRLWDFQIAAWLYLGRADRAADAIRRYGREPGAEEGLHWELEEPFGSNERAEIPSSLSNRSRVWYSRAEYQRFDRDLDGERRTMEQHRSTMEQHRDSWVYSWGSLGCAAQDQGRQDLRALAVEQLTAAAAQANQRRNALSSLARLGERELALSLIQQSGAPSEEAGALRDAIARAAAEGCGESGGTRAGRYRRLSRIATGLEVKRSNDRVDETRLQELIESQRADMTSRAMRGGDLVRPSALFSVGLNVAETARAYRYVHGPF